MDQYDVIIIGAGAAGLFCASVAGQRGARVALLDHSERLAEKIRISGGGRCNFTNLEADRPERFVSRNPTFARAALRAYPPRRFIDLVRSHDIAFHEKHRGQLFCDDSSERIIAMLVEECARGSVSLLRPMRVSAVAWSQAEARYQVTTEHTTLGAPRLVIATGGLSIPKIGASDFAYRLARQFRLPIIEPRPGLVPLTFDEPGWQALHELAGLSLEVDIEVLTEGAPSSPTFREDMLFTHRGLSGPAILQISSYWAPGRTLRIDLARGRDLEQPLLTAKRTSRQTLLGALQSEFGSFMPRRLLAGWLAASSFAADADKRVAELSNKRLVELALALRHWQVRPTGTEGFRKAEVTLGGVDTQALDPGTLEARDRAGLHFIGEAVDVTGWLGGYNFQWAWASAHAAALAVTRGM